MTEIQNIFADIEKAKEQGWIAYVVISQEKFDAIKKKYMDQNK